MDIELILSEGLFGDCDAVFLRDVLEAHSRVQGTDKAQATREEPYGDDSHAHRSPNNLRVVPWAVVVWTFDSGGVCSMGPHFVRGIQVAYIGVIGANTRGP